MKNTQYVFLFFSFCFIAGSFQACHTKNAARHSTKLVAVLPAEVILSGKQPKRLKTDQIEKLEEAESLIIQNKLVEAIVSSLAEVKKSKMGIVDPEKVNQKLQSSGISIRESWKAEPEVLAKLLGVDEVIKIKVTKTRYMSNLSGYGINLGTDILEILKSFYLSKLSINSESPEEQPESKSLGTTTTLDFFARSIRKSNGTVSWSYSQVKELEYNESVDQEIAVITKNAGAKFPKKSNGF
jgi:hypothetical protein